MPISEDFKIISWADPFFMDGKAVCWLPAPWGQPRTQKWRFSCYPLPLGTATDTKTGVFVSPAGLQAYVKRNGRLVSAFPRHLRDVRNHVPDSQSRIGTFHNPVITFKEHLKGYMKKKERFSFLNPSPTGGHPGPSDWEYQSVAKIKIVFGSTQFLYLWSY